MRTQYHRANQYRAFYSNDGSPFFRPSDFLLHHITRSLCLFPFPILNLHAAWHFHPTDFHAYEQCVACVCIFILSRLFTWAHCIRFPARTDTFSVKWMHTWTHNVHLIVAMMPSLSPSLTFHIQVEKKPYACGCFTERVKYLRLYLSNVRYCVGTFQRLTQRPNCSR